MKYANDELTTQLFMDAGIGSGMRVLDVGFGHGEVTRLVASLVGETGSVIGIDKNESAIATASSRLQELLLSMEPFCSEAMPLHGSVQQWIRNTVAYEGANLQMGLDLYRVS
ncbi:methyltransferase domain-containing protein [Rhodopirellula sp. JC639]|uniref:methyltransferase domain-containing protein n=1 Tax=Stieleria mannarensis TaxID=2755585 RepID=UPI00160389A2|nr:methyltransferase domain-containing protein [Rhodopirellula sp. JC639]